MRALCALAFAEILFHFKALLWGVNPRFSLLPPPICKAYPTVILMHDYCAIQAPSPTPPPPYGVIPIVITNIVHGIWHKGGRGRWEGVYRAIWSCNSIALGRLCRWWGDNIRIDSHYKFLK